MPAWPLASDFSNILQNTKLAFRDASLKMLEIEKDAHQQPRARSGAFANVYKGSDPRTREPICVRVFTSASAERRDRYRAISEYLATRRLASLVRFNYQNEGIRSAGDGKWYPLVTMDWVRGEQLFDWVQARCQRQDRAALGKAAEAWVAMLRELRAAQIAHGDLQHGNILVDEQDRLKLVDYDCMCVPALAGLKNLEIGVDPYQHPERNESTRLSENLDNFSALFIYVALRALAAEPDLWQAHVVGTQYDKLLIRREDLQEPGTSALIRRLRRSPDGEVQRLSQRLVELTLARLEQIPALDELLFSFSTVETLLNRRDFDAAVELFSRHRKQIVEAPAVLRPRLQDAQLRVAARLQLEQAVGLGDEAAMQRCYQPKLLDDYPTAQAAVQLARDAVRVVPVLARLEALSQRQQWHEFVRAWDQHQALLAGRKSAAAYAALADAWRKRNVACDELLARLRPPGGEPAQVAAAWDRLQQLGGHPASHPFRQQIDLIVSRHRAWVQFCNAPRHASDEADRLLVGAWDETLFAGWKPAEAQRPLAVAAQARLNLLDRVSRLTQQPVSPDSDRELADIGRQLPADYEFAQRAALAATSARRRALRALRKSLPEPASDIAIAVASQKLATAGGMTLLSAAEAQRVSLAIQRLPWLKRLKPLRCDYSPAQAGDHDAGLLQAWNEELLADCLDARPWRVAWKAARRRQKLLAALSVAIEGGDKLRAVALAADACLQDYPLPANWAQTLQAMARDAAAIQELLVALSGDDPRRLLSAFDAPTIAKNEAHFAPHRQKLLAWMGSDILPAARMRLGPPLAQPAISHRAGALWICWNWPQPRFTDTCVLAVSRDEPGPADELNNQSLCRKLHVDRRSFEDAGGGRLLQLEPAWDGCYISVWAIVNLGFRALASEPVVLGQLAGPLAAARLKPKGALW